VDDTVFNLFPCSSVTMSELNFGSKGSVKVTATVGGEATVESGAGTITFGRE
jgi:spore coat protein U-like protein